MRLKVDAQQLAEFAGQVQRGAEDTGAMLQYLSRFGHLTGPQGGLLSIAAGGHETVRGTVHGALQRLEVVLRESARELHAAAAYYRRTDAGVAADMDASYATARR
ncbi:type VII secretion target [Streptomyces sp. NPDC049585]|uniref:type VII secretion target n=1 Tax=Streptomyces sp. NPDC049585 TaxID=3155154 RepID=UPI003435AF25